MKQISFLLLLLFCSLNIKAQQSETITPARYVKEQSGFIKYLARSIRPIDSEQHQKENGVTYASSIIGEEGKLVRAWIEQAFHPEFDQEVLRVIQAMNAWEPAQKEG